MATPLSALLGRVAPRASGTERRTASTASLNALLAARPISANALPVQPFNAEQTCFHRAATDDGTFAIGSQSTVALVSDAAAEAELLCTPALFGPPMQIEWRLDASVVLLAQLGHREPGCVSIFDVTRDGGLIEPSLVERPRQHGSVWCAAWCHARTDAFAVGGTRRAYFCVLAQGTSRRRDLSSDTSDVFCTAFNEAGTVLFHGARDGNVRSVDLRAGPPAVSSHLPLLHDDGSVSKIVVEHDALLLVASRNGVVQRWDLRMPRDATHRFAVPVHSALQPLAMSATSDVLQRCSSGVPLLAVGTSEGHVHLWPLGARSDTKPIRTHALGVSGITGLQFDNAASLTTLWAQSTSSGVVKLAA